MANRIQIRRGTAAQLVGKTVNQGELLWVSDKKKLYIGTIDNGVVQGTFPEYKVEGSDSVVKVISPDAKEVAYLNTISGLDATNVQEALDELAAEKQEKLGGTSDTNGKVVIASDTLGTVTYRTIDDTISESSDGSDHLVTANAIWDNSNALNIAKQDKVTTAVENNIATWDDKGNTKDSGKSITTIIDTTTPSDEKIPTEKAVTTAISNALTTAVNYKGACDESDLPTSGQKIGDYYTILDFNVTYPGQHRDGRAIWNGTGWDKVVDDFFGPDDDYIVLTSDHQGNDESTSGNSAPKLTLKDQYRENTTSTQTATFSGSVLAIDSITTNDKGQVIKVNTKTVTMPSLGNTATTAAQGNLAEYIANKTNTIRTVDLANDTLYPTEKAVRTELDKKANKVDIVASTNYSLVNYNSQGIVISGIDYIDGGTF